jgi:hypothetical protein
MASTLSLKAIGLNTNPNQLDLPEGSLIEADNVIIDRDNVIEPRRGFKLFGEAFGTDEDRAKQMWEYKDRIIRHYGSKLEFQNGTNNDGTANFDEFSGTYSEPRTGLRIKKADASGNSYFTTSDGIKKISAKLATDLSTASGFIKRAGAVKAVDFKASLTTTNNDQSSFLPQDSAVAYRVLWLYKDANENLIRGAPSQREEVYNSLSRLLVMDLLRVLLALDNISTAGSSLIDDANYVNTLKVDINSTAVEIQTALTSLATKIDTDIVFANDGATGGAPLNLDTTGGTISSGVYTVPFTSGTPSDYFAIGDKIYLSGFFPATGTRLPCRY